MCTYPTNLSVIAPQVMLKLMRTDSSDGILQNSRENSSSIGQTINRFMVLISKLAIATVSVMILLRTRHRRTTLSARKNRIKTWLMHVTLKLFRPREHFVEGREGQRWLSHVNQRIIEIHIIRMHFLSSKYLITRQKIRGIVTLLSDSVHASNTKF